MICVVLDAACCLCVFFILGEYRGEGRFLFLTCCCCCCCFPVSVVPLLFSHAEPGPTADPGSYDRFDELVFGAFADLNTAPDGGRPGLEWFGGQYGGLVGQTWCHDPSPKEL